MKNPLIFLIATLFCTFQLSADPYAYTIVEHPYRFSTYFEMQGKKGFEGKSIAAL